MGRRQGLGAKTWVSLQGRHLNSDTSLTTRLTQCINVTASHWPLEMPSLKFGHRVLEHDDAHLSQLRIPTIITVHTSITDRDIPIRSSKRAKATHDGRQIPGGRVW